jgi:hypothetical protein
MNNSQFEYSMTATWLASANDIIWLRSVLYRSGVGEERCQVFPDLRHLQYLGECHRP